MSFEGESVISLRPQGRPRFELSLEQEFMGALVGGIVCPGGIRLAHFLCSLDPAVLAGKRCVEVGAGTGVAGLALARLGADKVVLTDLPDVLELLEGNVRSNACDDGADVLVRPLLWDDLQTVDAVRDEALGGRCDLVLAAECFYVHEWVEPLVAVLRRLGGRALVCGVPLPNPALPLTDRSSVLSAFLTGMTQGGYTLLLVSLMHADPYAEEEEEEEKDDGKDAGDPERPREDVCVAIVGEKEDNPVQAVAKATGLSVQQLCKAVWSCCREGDDEGADWGTGRPYVRVVPCSSSSSSSLHNNG